MGKSLKFSWSVGVLLVITISLAILFGVHGLYSGRVDPLMWIQFGACYGPRLPRGEWWRLFSSVLSHGSILAVIVHTVALALSGRLVRKFQAEQVIMAFLLSALGGTLLMLTLAPFGIFLCGAMGIFGVYGLWLGFHISRRDWTTLKKESFALIAFAIFATFDMYTNSKIGWAGIGMASLVGFALGWVRSERQHFDFTTVAVSSFIGALALVFFIPMHRDLSRSPDRIRAAISQLNEGIEKVKGMGPPKTAVLAHERAELFKTEVVAPSHELKELAEKIFPDNIGPAAAFGSNIRQYTTLVAAKAEMELETTEQLEKLLILREGLVNKKTSILDTVQLFAGTLAPGALRTRQNYINALKASGQKVQEGGAELKPVNDWGHELMHQFEEIVVAQIRDAMVSDSRNYLKLRKTKDADEASLTAAHNYFETQLGKHFVVIEKEVEIATHLAPSASATFKRELDTYITVVRLARADSSDTLASFRLQKLIAQSKSLQSTPAALASYVNKELMTIYPVRPQPQKTTAQVPAVRAPSSTSSPLDSHENDRRKLLAQLSQTLLQNPRGALLNIEKDWRRLDDSAEARLLRSKFEVFAQQLSAH